MIDLKMPVQKPCPFCGRGVVFSIRPDGIRTEIRHIDRTVEDLVDPCIIEILLGQSLFQWNRGSQNVMLEKWNTRVNE